MRITTNTDIAKHKSIGQADGGFVIPKSELDSLIARTDGDKKLIEEALGLEPGRFSNGDTVIAWIKPENLDGLRFPNGNEATANGAWLPGGMTPGGHREAIINMPKNTVYTPITIGN